MSKPIHSCPEDNPQSTVVGSIRAKRVSLGSDSSACLYWTALSTQTNSGWEKLSRMHTCPYFLGLPSSSIRMFDGASPLPVARVMMRFMTFSSRRRILILSSPSRSPHSSQCLRCPWNPAVVKHRTRLGSRTGLVKGSAHMDIGDVLWSCQSLQTRGIGIAATQLTKSHAHSASGRLLQPKE